MVETCYTVEPVTQFALFRLGYRSLIVGPRGECCGFHRTVQEARQTVDRLNNPPPRPR